MSGTNKMGELDTRLVAARSKVTYETNLMHGIARRLARNPNPSPATIAHLAKAKARVQEAEAHLADVEAEVAARDCGALS